MNTSYLTQNGWTKESMKEAIRKNNTGEKAYSQTRASCMYQTPEGNRCAVGCFMNGEELEEWGSYELSSCDLMMEDNPPTMPLVMDGLHAMQGIHDHYNDDGDVRDILCTWIDTNVEDA